MLASTSSRVGRAAQQKGPVGMATLSGRQPAELSMFASSSVSPSDDVGEGCGLESGVGFQEDSGGCCVFFRSIA